VRPPLAATGGNTLFYAHAHGYGLLDGRCSQERAGHERKELRKTFALRNNKVTKQGTEQKKDNRAQSTGWKTRRRALTSAGGGCRLTGENTEKNGMRLLEGGERVQDGKGRHGPGRGHGGLTAGVEHRSISF